MNWTVDPKEVRFRQISLVTDKLYHLMLYRVHLVWVEFELATLAVIDTDCIGSCNSNNHMILNLPFQNTWAYPSSTWTYPSRAPELTLPEHLNLPFQSTWAYPSRAPELTLPEHLNLLFQSTWTYSSRALELTLPEHLNLPFRSTWTYWHPYIVTLVT
jgi:hypothetical protein